jgi:outer membrane receptor protein involved in Fe transport
MSINQIPADQIEQIEVITNPSSKYEAQTAGGIINIVLKKNRKPGYNGIISAGVGTQNRYNGMFNINIKQGRWNTIAFYNFNKSNNPTEGYVYRTYKNPTSWFNKFNQDTDTDFDNLFQIARLQTEYSINNRNTLTVSGTYVEGRFDIRSYQDYAYLTASGSKIIYGERDVIPENRFKNYMAQANWKRTYPKKGKELVLDISYAAGGSSNEAIWKTTTYSPTIEPLVKNPTINDIDGGNKGQQIVAQLDYVNPLNDSTKVEWGLRSYWNNRTQEFFFYSFDSADIGPRIRNDKLSQLSDINDAINAAYATYTSRWKDINYQVGLRFEQSELIGDSKLDKTKFGYNYPKSADDIFNALFPSLFISKKFGKTTEWQANFSRKINRPNFMQLMPVIMNNDPLNIRTGNQALQPEFINLAEINFQKTYGKRANTWLASVYMRAEENPIVTIGRPLQAGSDVLVTTFENGQSALRYGLDNTLKFNLPKDVDITANFNLFNINVQATDISNSGWAWNGKANINWKLPKKLKDFSMQMNASYESDQILPQGVRKGIYFFDYAVKYTFNRVSSLTFQIVDITNTRREILWLDQTNFTQESMRRRDLRFYRLTFQMPFGKADSSIFRRMKDAQKQRSNQQSQDMDFGG